jgi:hypothetical protein
MCEHVAETGLNLAAIHEFTPEGRFVRSFHGGREIGTRLTGSPSLVFHPDGRLLVPSGSSTDALLAFRKGGTVVRRFANIICGPVCVGPPGSGEIYAVYSSGIGCHIRVYDRAGKLRRAFGHTGAGVNYCGIAVTSQGHVWVGRLENEKNVLIEFSPDDAMRRTVSLPGLLQYAPLAVDSQDHLYVPCPRTGDVQVLSPEGKVVKRFDLRGKIAPSAAAVSEDGRLWVAGNTA